MTMKIEIFSIWDGCFCMGGWDDGVGHGMAFVLQGKGLLFFFSFLFFLSFFSSFFFLPKML
jgi:hypothetical protein